MVDTIEQQLDNLHNNISKNLESSQNSLQRLLQEIKDDNARWAKELEDKKNYMMMKSEFFQLIRIKPDWENDRIYMEYVRDERGF